MPKTRRTATLVLLAVVLLAAPALAQNVLTGQTASGAFYTIAVPPQWNGGVVIYNHGFSLTPGGPGPSLGPLQDLQLLEGFAIAASSYSEIGWVFNTNTDLEELMEAFREQVGQPNRIYMFGISLGGMVTARALEQADLGAPVVGALTICGANAGSRNWDAGLDVRLIYDAVCKDVAGANIPGAAKGLPLFSTLTPTDVALRTNACFGHDLPPSVRTAAQQQRLNLFLAVSQIPQSFINTSLGFFATFGMAELVHNPTKLGGQIGTGNRRVDYGNATINATIQRVGASPAKRRLLRDNFTPRGNVRGTKIVAIHTSQDGLVIVENLSEYASIVPRPNLSVGVVMEADPTHCGFSAAETAAGWEVLRGWVAGDPQPSALTLQIYCAATESTFGGPCRFNPFFPIPDMDGRIRRRNPGNRIRASQVKSSPAAGSSQPAAAASAPQAAPQAAATAAAAEASTPDEPELPAVRQRLSRKLDRRER